MADDTIKSARDFLSRAQSNETTNRKNWKADVEFARMGKQWPEGIRKRRLTESRPCLTVNKLAPVIRQVVNDARQNRPSIKVLPQDDKADPETAEVMTGLIRNIEQSSNADVAYDTAIDAAASGGFGYWRINLDYASDISLDAIQAGGLGTEAFTQDLCIKRVINPLSIYGDPNSIEADSSDWMEALVVDKLSEAEFSKKWPKAAKSSFDSVEWQDCPDGWKTDKEITVAEYWVREEVVIPVIAIQMPPSVDEAGGVTPGDVVVMPLEQWQKLEKEGQQGEHVAGPRPVKSYRVTQHTITGVEVLETKKWPGQYIPIVPVYGDEVIVDGERFFRSLIADAKGPQEMYNFWVTQATELVALAPRQPYIGPKGAFRSDQAKWSTANTASHSFIEYDGPAAPQRQAPPSVPAADLQMSLTASDEIKAVTGIYDASLGARSNETSGIAIRQRQKEGDVSTFHFIDNLSRAIRHTGKILLDLIPKVYSTPRIIRILGEDGTPENRQINQQYAAQDDAGQQVMRIHDFQSGRYDLAVTTGPSFTTKREESAAQMIELIRAYPAAAEVIGDLLAKNLDWPGADEIADRLKKMLPPNLQDGPNSQLVEQNRQLASENTQLKQDKAISAGELQVKQFEAETERMRAANEAITPQQIQALVVQTVQQLLTPQQLPQ